MAGNFWKQFGDTYDKVNDALGGLPDAVKNIASKASGPVMAGISNFDQSMMQSLPGQIGKAVGGPIANAIQPGSSQRLETDVNQQAQAGQEQYPVAALAGQGGALAGQMLTSPIVPAAEAGTVAARLAPTLGRNLLNAAGTTVPGAISQGVQTGDWGTAVSQGAKDTALGGILGTAGEKVLGSLPHIINAIKKTMTNQALTGGLDLNTKILNKVTNYGPIGKFAGAAIGRINDLKEQLINFMVDNPAVKTEAGRQAVVDAMDQKWGAVDDAFKGYKPPPGMGKVRSFQDEIMNHPLVQDVLTANPDRLSDLDTMISKADTGKDLPATRHILQKDYIDPSFAPGSKTDDEQTADLARGIHDVIDDHFVPDDLKEQYAKDKVLKEILKREDLKLSNATTPGSPTFARLMANAAMGGFGGETAGIMGGQDPEDALRTAAMSAGAGLVGGVGGRLVSKGINKGLAGGQARLAQLLGNIPEGALTGAEQMAPRIAQAAARGPQMAQTNAAVQPPDIGTPVPAGPGATPADQTTQVPTVPIPNAPSQPQMTGANWQTGPGVPVQAEAPKLPPEHAEGITQATNKEQELTSQQVTAARQSISPQFMDTIHQKILTDYQNWESPYKPDFDTFQSQIMSSTNNLDPKNINTAKIIGGPNYKDYLKSYNVALNLQSLGKDLVSAINYSPAYHPLGFTGTEEKEKHDELVHTLYTAMTGDMKDPDKATQKSIENTLFSLRRLGSNNAKTKALYNILEKEYGIRFDMLKQYGLTQ